MNYKARNLAVEGTDAAQHMGPRTPSSRGVDARRAKVMALATAQTSARARTIAAKSLKPAAKHKIKP